jgi:hypothetical protein
MDQFTQDYAPKRRRRRRALVAMLLASSLATVGAGAMSLAVFTDSKASTGSWTTGTVILGVDPSTAFTATGIMPGDTGSQTVTVTNSGTGALRYAMTSTPAETDGKGLTDQMQLTISDAACGSTGTVIYTGTLGAAALGDPTQGAQAGDRTLASGTSDSLCFEWSFPLSSGDTYQGASASTTFTFDAEQTANN